MVQEDGFDIEKNRLTVITYLFNIYHFQTINHIHFHIEI